MTSELLQRLLEQARASQGKVGQANIAEMEAPRTHPDFRPDVNESSFKPLGLTDAISKWKAAQKQGNMTQTMGSVFPQYWGGGAGPSRNIQKYSMGPQLKQSDQTNLANILRQLFGGRFS